MRVVCGVHPPPSTPTHERPALHLWLVENIYARGVWCDAALCCLPAGLQVREWLTWFEELKVRKASSITSASAPGGVVAGSGGENPGNGTDDNTLQPERENTHQDVQNSGQTSGTKPQPKSIVCSVALCLGGGALNKANVCSCSVCSCTAY
jgi:hypothetical protein